VPRTPKPWFWASRQSYYVTIRGGRHNLGPDKAEAERRFHELMARDPLTVPAATPPSGLAEPLAAQIFDRFLDWCQKHRAARTYEWYRDHIQDFLKSLPGPGTLAAAAVRPFHVVEWVDAHPGWSAVYRRGAITAIQRPFNWAVRLGYLDTTPLRHVEKPRPQRREQAVTPEQFVRMRDHYPPDDPFRDLLEFCWDTGCRPQEVTRIEARHVDLARLRVTFAAAEAKGRRPRVVHLTDHAARLLARLIACHPSGPVFRNAQGRPWTRFAINCRFCRLKDHLGAKFAAYSLRHGFGTRKLVEGHDALTVAELMGHRDPRMLATVYQHLDQRDEYLREALRGGSSASV
jgi:integrase